MSSRHDTDGALRLAAHARAAHLVDGEAIRQALLGTPVALTALERGASITIADLDGLERTLVARGLRVTRCAVDVMISRRRRALPAARRDLLVTAAHHPAHALIDAVRGRDPDLVREILTGRDVEELHVLAIVLAALAGAAEGPDR